MTRKVLWQPDEAFKKHSNIQIFINWLYVNKNFGFNNYQELWEWSVTDPSAFWESLWEYFKIISHTPYSKAISDDLMPHTQWFEGSTLNYAEHVFRNKTTAYPAIMFKPEQGSEVTISWEDLEKKTEQFAIFLRSKGVKKGDCVAGFISNIPEATIAFLATISLGAIWSSCSQDFGVESVVDRLIQISPKVLITSDGYFYASKKFDKTQEVSEIKDKITSISQVVVVDFIGTAGSLINREGFISWEAATNYQELGGLSFEPVPFAHPIWVLYSSGTTGAPKAITHSHGGVLLEHLKYLTFHNDVKPGERFFWYSTTGWMMWNFANASLLAGATLVMYDGSAVFPSMKSLWAFADTYKINHFGTSAPFIIACMKAAKIDYSEFDLSSLRSIGSTGSPLPPEAFEYIYNDIKKDIWLCSMSGGTDVCTAFVGGCPLLPVYLGEIQCRALGCDMHAFDDLGHPVIDEMGEMVILKPMPSMPVYFWNDPDGSKYNASYFDIYPGGIWRHGDWLSIFPDGGLVIYGRSDATLNRHGIRIGTSEIYRAIDKIEEVKDSLVVNLELSGGRHYMPLFVELKDGFELNEELLAKIKQQLRSNYSPRHVPDEIVQVPEIPYTISGKKMEAPVKKILMGMSVERSLNLDSMRNPESIEFYKVFSQKIEK